MALTVFFFYVSRLIFFFLLSSFVWKTSDWTECKISLLTDQDTASQVEDAPQCGGGIQTRQVFCAQSIMESGKNKGECSDHAWSERSFIVHSVQKVLQPKTFIAYPIGN